MGGILGSLPRPIQLHRSRRGSHLVEPNRHHAFLVARWTQRAPFPWVWPLYHGGHSLVVFAAVFGLVWAILGRPVLEMLGWAPHILIDTMESSPSISLWPLSNYGFNGIRWENRWFLALNYAALPAILACLWAHAKKCAPAVPPSG